MTQEPASPNPYASLTIGQLIGLNLARLYTWLVGLHTSGETRAPNDIAQMVASTDAMVQAYIRALASAQLERAGFTFAALAMRDPIRDRISRRHEQSALSGLYANEKFARANENAEGAAEPSSRGITASIQTEQAQSCQPATPTQLIQRLETTIDTFERAEHLASALARVIVFAMIYVSLHASSRSLSAPNSIQPDAGRSARPIGAVSTANWREIRQPISPPTPVPLSRGPPLSCHPGRRPGMTS